jgi:hypothetical protein
MRKRKVERWNQILDAVEKIQKISSEIRPADFVPFKVPVDQSDLSCRKLEELRVELQSLEKEKVCVHASCPLLLSSTFSVSHIC